MDSSSIARQLVGVLWYLIPLLAFAAILKSAWFKGVVGEFIVNLSIRLFLDRKRYHLVTNVTLPCGNGTAQIDHVIVSRFGVFVVETKNMKGWIFGAPDQKTWIQQIYRHKNRFQNPLHQNFKHARVIEEMLGLDGGQVFSVVVFVGDSTFKTKMPDNVTYGMGCIRYIRSKTRPVLSEAEVRRIRRKIESARLPPSLKTRREHIRNVKAAMAGGRGHRKCPECGSFMVKRKDNSGRRAGGGAWRCSKFPRCRGGMA